MDEQVANPGIIQPSFRRVALIGDIHCEDERLATVLRHFSSVDVDATVAVGDMVDGEGDANRVCDLLAHSRVLAVMGNHDRWFLENRMREVRDATPQSALNSSAHCWLEQLPKTRSFQTRRGPLLLCHGMGEDDMNRIYPDSAGYELESNLTLTGILRAKQYRFVINGHTHQPMVRRIQQLTIINSGSLCRQLRPVCSIVDFEEGSVQFFDVKSDNVVSAERVAFDTK